MPAKLLIDIPTMNWAYTVLLEQEREYSFGSAKGSSVTLPSHVASENHAVVRFNTGWVVQDCGSKAGTYVNGQAVAEARPLRDRDILKIGTCEVVFQNPEIAAGKAEVDHTRR